MVAMEDAPENHQSNNNDMNRQRNMRQMKAELARDKVFKHAGDEFIEAFVYHRMWSSAACWKTIGAVIEGLKKLQYKKDKLGVLKDNIKIRYLGLGWDECKTQWSKVGVTLSIVDLTNRLKDLMRLGGKQVGCPIKA